MYIRAGEVRKKYNISVSTLANWADQGRIRFIRPGRNRYYHKEDIVALCQQRSYSQDHCTTLCYARVGTNHQQEDLDRQCGNLTAQFPGAEIISDIGSGLDWDRKGFRKLLELVYEGNVARVVVEYKDRLCRFGFELFEWICEKHGVEVVVLNPNACADQYTSGELSEDLLVITNQSAARNSVHKPNETYKKKRQYSRKPRNARSANNITEESVAAIAHNANMQMQEALKASTEQDDVLGESAAQPDIS